MSDQHLDISSLQQQLRTFARERDWDQFHSPKNLSMALSVEAAELLEIFQWLTEDQSQNLTQGQLDAVKDELADIQIYLARIADKLNVNLPDAVANKLEANAAKYPAEKVRGSARKYTEYEPDR